MSKCNVRRFPIQMQGLMLCSVDMSKDSVLSMCVRILLDAVGSEIRPVIPSLNRTPICT